MTDAVEICEDRRIFFWTTDSAVETKYSVGGAFDCFRDIKSVPPTPGERTLSLVKLLYR